MAASESEKAGSDLGVVLKPFYKRASEAEDRLSRLEAALARTKDGGNEELMKKISELETKLEGVHAELASEQEKVKRLGAENGKLQYRVLHLVQAVRESDAKLEHMTGVSEANAQTTAKLQDLPAIVNKK